MSFTLDRLVEEAAARAPNAPAVTFGAETKSYRELDSEASIISGMLAGLGVRPGDRVGLYMPKSIRAVSSILGIMRSGAAYVPIDPGAPPDRARFILEHCQVAALVAGGAPLQALLKSGGTPPAPAIAVADDTALEELGAAGFRRITRLEDAIAHGALAPEARMIGGSWRSRRPIDSDLAYVLYTSGSTGTPKGVAITHAQSLAFVRPAAAVFELTASDVLVSHAPFNFDLSVIDLYCAFFAGASVVLIPERFGAFPVKVSELVERAGVTVWNSVPSALVQLTTHGRLAERDLSRLRLIMFAGEPYPVRHLRALRAIAPKSKLLNIYGQTEANSSTYYSIDRIPEDDHAPIPIGKTFPNYDVFALDLEGKHVALPGVEGELYVRGGAVASGYFRDPDRTALAFVQHPLEPGRRDIVYKTGDRVMYDQNGDLIFLGRADAVVKVRGFRVELGEIEAVAGAIGGIAECAAIPVPNEETTNRLVLFATLTEGANVEAGMVLDAIAQKLPRYMIPEKVIFDPGLPRNANGKIDRRALAPRAKAALLT
jgi:amino acid adenylation domain-containing protein